MKKTLILTFLLLTIQAAHSLKFEWTHPLKSFETPSKGNVVFPLKDHATSDDWNSLAFSSKPALGTFTDQSKMVFMTKIINPNPKPKVIGRQKLINSYIQKTDSKEAQDYLFFIDYKQTIIRLDIDKSETDEKGKQTNQKTLTLDTDLYTPKFVKYINGKVWIGAYMFKSFPQKFKIILYNLDFSEKLDEYDLESVPQAYITENPIDFGYVEIKDVGNFYFMYEVTKNHQSITSLNRSSVHFYSEQEKDGSKRLIQKGALLLPDYMKEWSAFPGIVKIIVADNNINIGLVTCTVTTSCREAILFGLTPLDSTWSKFDQSKNFLFQNFYENTIVDFVVDQNNSGKAIISSLGRSAGKKQVLDSIFQLDSFDLNTKISTPIKTSSIKDTTYDYKDVEAINISLSTDSKGIATAWVDIGGTSPNSDCNVMFKLHQDDVNNTAEKLKDVESYIDSFVYEGDVSFFFKKDTQSFEVYKKTGITMKLDGVDITKYLNDNKLDLLKLTITAYDRTGSSGMTSETDLTTMFKQANYMWIVWVFIFQGIIGIGLGYLFWRKKKNGNKGLFDFKKVGNAGMVLINDEEKEDYPAQANSGGLDAKGEKIEEAKLL